jgi:hypothetical protein
LRELRTLLERTESNNSHFKINSGELLESTELLFSSLNVESEQNIQTINGIHLHASDQKLGEFAYIFKAAANWTQKLIWWSQISQLARFSISRD